MAVGRRRRRKKCTERPAKRKKQSGSCLLCCKETDTDSSVIKLSAENEKECYRLLLEALGVGPESFVNLIQDWGNGSFTFCEDCGAAVEQSLLIMEEIKSLNQQLNRIRSSIAKNFKAAEPATTNASRYYSETARRTLTQCYQACIVKLSSCPPSGTALRSSPRRKTKKEVGFISAGTPTTLKDGSSVVYKEEDEDQNESEIEAEDVNSPYFDCGNAESTDYNYEENHIEDQADEHVQRYETRYRTQGYQVSTVNGVVEVTERVRASNRYQGSSVYDRERAEVEGNIDDQSNSDDEDDNDINDEEWTPQFERKENTKQPVRVTESSQIREKLPEKKKQKKILVVDSSNLCLQKLKCPFCDLQSNLSAFGHHISGTHGLLYSLGVYACRSCGDVTRSREKKYLSEFLSMHQQCVPNDELKCMHCEEQFTSVELIPEHYATKHPCSRKCNVCEHVFPSLSSVVHHQTKTWRHVTMNSSVDVSAGTARMMDRKDDQKLEKVESGRNCDICGIFVTTSNVQHSRIHGYLDVSDCLICTKCGKIEVKSGDMSRCVKDFFARHESCEPVPNATVSCTECKAVFITVRSLALHWIRMHAAKPCALCDKSFQDLADLSSHEFTVHDVQNQAFLYRKKEGLLRCPFCSSKYSSWEDLSKHRWSHRGYLDDLATTSLLPIPTESIAQITTERFQLENCDVVVDISDTCSTELNQEHPPDLSSTGELPQSASKASYCALCGLRLSSIEEIRRHRVKAHNLRKKVPSPVVRIKSETELQNYLTWYSQLHRNKGNSNKLVGKATQDGDTPYQCTMCDQSFSSCESREFEYHVLRQHGLVYYLGFYGCRSCGDIFPTKVIDKERLLVFSKEHRNCRELGLLSRVDGYDCVCCLENLDTFEDLMQHVEDLHIDELGPYCDICGMKFVTYLGRKTHMEAAHQKDISCLRKFLYIDPSPFPLTPNFEHEGTEEECGLCGNDFDKSRPEALAEHVAQQHGICYVSGIYGCARCMTVYTSSLGRSLHDFQIFHSACKQQEKLGVSCHSCSLEFNTFNELVQHTKENHNLLLKFLCYICGRRYTSLLSLRGHHKADHASQASFETSAEPHGFEKYHIGEILRCQLCEEDLYMGEGTRLVVHMKNVHNLCFKSGFFCCVKCAEYYDEKVEPSFAEFQRRHATCEEVDLKATVKCSKCCRQMQAAKIPRHFKFHVKGRKTCQLCGKSLKFSKMNMHYLNFHQVRLTSTYLGSVLYPNLMKPENIQDLSAGDLALNDEWICRICLKRFPVSHDVLLEEHVKDTHHLLVALSKSKEAYGCENCECIQIYGPEDGIIRNQSKIIKFSNMHGVHCTTSKSDEHKCSSCNTCLDSFQALMNHIVKCTMHKLGYNCRKCKYYLANITSYNRHMKTHDQKEPTFNQKQKHTAGSSKKPCAVCGIVTLHTRRIAHLRDSHGLEYNSGIFGCIKCWEVVDPSSGTSVQDFVKIHHCPDGVSADVHSKCTRCEGERSNYNFPSLRLKCMHIDKAHIHPERHVCEHCGKTYAAKHNLNDHLRLHIDPDAFKCPDPGCDRVFQTQYSLRLHLRVVRGEIKNICEICGKEFQYGIDLKSHIKAHAQIRDVKCKLCDKMFWNKNNMRSHIREFHRKARKDRFKNKRKTAIAQSAESVPDSEKSGV